MADPTAPIQHLVLGVDDGDYSWEALDLARAVADSVGAQLHAFHATTDKVPDHLIHRAKEADLPMRSTVTFPGSEGVARALIDHAADLDNAVAALTSHARRGITAALWANEPFGLREVLGIGLITAAGMVEFLYAPIRRALWRDRRAPS